MPTITVYHVFTHNTDEYVDTLIEAEDLFKQFVEDYGSARLYEEIRNDDEEKEVIDENCLKSFGPWPQ